MSDWRARRRTRWQVRTRPARSLTIACGALVAVAGLGFGACGDDGGARQAREPTLRVYVSVPLRGSAGVHGRAIRDGAKLALADAGGRAGESRVEAVFLDDTAGPGRRARWSPVVVADNARRAAQDSAAIAYIGDFQSAATRASLPITNQAMLLQVSPASTATDLVRPRPGTGTEVPPLVQPTGQRTFARVIPDDERQAEAGGAWARRLGARRAAIVSDGSRFGRSVAAEFAEEAEALGIAVEVEQSLAEAGPSGVARRIAASRPDLVYYGGTAKGGGGMVETALSLLDRIAAAAPEVTIMGTDALLLDSRFVRRASGIESRLQLTAAAQDASRLPPQSGGQRFVRDYRRRFGGEPNPYAAYGYEAMALVLDSIERADVTEGRSGVIDALLSTADRRSVLGTYSIDEVGNTTLDRLAGYRIRDGKPVFAAGLRAP